MEWFSVLIPLVGAVLLFKFFRHRVTWWECIIPMLPVLVIVPLVAMAARSALIIDYERHGGWIVEARYYEDWDEWITQLCTRTVSCGKDCTTTEVYDCSYRLYHPPEWYLYDSNGYQIAISSETFEELASRFKSRAKVDMHRAYYWKDGDMFSAVWPNEEKTRVHVTTEHRYENRVQATTGVFAYDAVDKPHERGIFDYPNLINHLDDPAILGIGPEKSIADEVLQMANAKMGRRKQVRMWICLFHNQPRSVAFDQESHWKGGNKNEVTVCIGLDNHDMVQWCHVFCWSPDGNTSNDQMKIAIRNGVEQQKRIDLIKAADLLISEVDAKFIRKPFKEFSYLTVSTPQWAVWLIFSLSLISTVAIGFWAVMNEIDEQNDPLVDAMAQYGR